MNVGRITLTTLRYESRHNTLFGRGMSETTQVLRYRAYVEMHIAEVVQVFTEPPYFEGECKFFVED